MYSKPAGAARQALWGEPCLAARVRRVHRVVTRRYDHALARHDLTAAQLDLLMTLLTTEDAVRCIDLARALQMERSTVTRNVQRLRVRGLVASDPGPSGREAQVRVTAAGRAAAEHAAEAWFGVQQEIRARLGDEGVAALELLAHRLTDDEETS
jgi:DNA-binding MarR family transcriptional regulator